MKDITKITYLLLGLMLSVPLAAQKTYYMDPEGSDSNPGTSDKPFATLVKVQEVVVAGDVVYINPGTYVVPANQVPMTTTNSGLYHCVFHMNKVVKQVNLFLIWLIRINRGGPFLIFRR